ncbi:hypothetical protein Poly21_23030 [Allorhodopirellula heiligendammensis]|uniref:Uncharacterized protein n=1 Tax=Allorhodopirellula heiligendammensis TaxID=2714739 RepID=A0A5C6BUJ1_9BACT|nr:hypothetical protein Poly21_23030 [Allorhodopirellula heiligendammensis]
MRLETVGGLLIHSTLVVERCPASPQAASRGRPLTRGGSQYRHPVDALPQGNGGLCSQTGFDTSDRVRCRHRSIATSDLFSAG